MGKQYLEQGIEEMTTERDQGILLREKGRGIIMVKSEEEGGPAGAGVTTPAGATRKRDEGDRYVESVPAGARRSEVTRRQAGPSAWTVSERGRQGRL